MTNVHQIQTGDLFNPEKQSEKQAEKDRKNRERARERQALRVQAAEVLDFLNEKAAKRFRPVDANLKFIVARLESGITPDELRQVIAAKCRAWKTDPRMREYLRPKTLFCETNCENYLGELLG